MGRKLGFCCAGPALPAAQQLLAARHCTVESWSKVWPVVAPGTMLHAPPFHCSIKALRFSPFWSLAYPTAKQLDAEIQLTPCRTAPTTPGPVGVGLGTTDQALPFQFSMRVPVGFPFPLTPRTAPTAQQSDPVTHETLNSPPPRPGGSGGGAASVQVVPFQVSASGEKVPLELMFWIEIPTAQHWTALGQDDPSRMSSAPVPGVVATYQPEGDAALPSGETMPTVESTSAVKAPAKPAAGPFSRGRRACVPDAPSWKPWLHGPLPDQWMVGSGQRRSRSLDSHTGATSVEGEMTSGRGRN